MSLALFALCASAFATESADVVVDAGPDSAVVVTVTDDSAAEVAPCDDDDDDDRGADRDDRHNDEDGRIELRYATTWLPDTVAGNARGAWMFHGDNYLSGEIRYAPDFTWTGRVGAGIDVLGRGNWDLQLGLFLGSAGTWEGVAVMESRPEAGTEIAFGIESDRLFGKYRWVAGIGGGELDDLLTENELTVGLRLLGELRVFGQYVMLAPKASDARSGLGAGLSYTF